MSFWSRLKAQPVQDDEESVDPETVSLEAAASQRIIRTVTARCFVGNDSHLLYSSATGEHYGVRKCEGA